MTEYMYSWWICLFLGHLYFIHCIEPLESNFCTNTSISRKIPEVSFCKNSHAVGTELAMNGYYSNSMKEENDCSCIIQTSDNITLFFGSALYAPDEISQECGSEIAVTHSDRSLFKIECKENPTQMVKSVRGDMLNTVLRKISDPKDTRYCIYITKGKGAATIEVTCFSNTVVKDVTPTSIKTQGRTSFMFTTLISGTILNSTNEKLYVSNDESFFSVVALAAVGWGLALAFGITTFVLFCKQIRHTKEQSKCNNQYEDLHGSTGVSTYSSMTLSTNRSQNYEEVSSNTV